MYLTAEQAYREGLSIVDAPEHTPDVRRIRQKAKETPEQLLARVTGHELHYHDRLLRSDVERMIRRTLTPE